MYKMYKKNVQKVINIILYFVFFFTILDNNLYANGVGWGPPQLIFPYEIGVVLFEWLCISFFLKQNIFKSLYFSFVANLCSFILGIGVFVIVGVIHTIIVPWSSQAIPSFILWTYIGQIMVFLISFSCEFVVLLKLGGFQPDMKFFRVVFFMNLFTWSIGVWLLSEMIKAG